MSTQSTYTWSDLKSQLNALDKSELLRLVRDLWGLSADNKRFLTARVLAASPEARSAPYRAIISQAFQLERGKPLLDLRAARSALSEYRKAGADPVEMIDLMLFYVEEGVGCVRQYEDIGESVYDSIYRVFDDAVEALSALDDDAVGAEFHPRIEAILDSTSGGGWGLHEALVSLYADRFAPIEEEER